VPRAKPEWMKELALLLDELPPIIKTVTVHREGEKDLTLPDVIPVYRDACLRFKRVKDAKVWDLELLANMLGYLARVGKVMSIATLARDLHVLTQYIERSEEDENGIAYDKPLLRELERTDFCRIDGGTE
jgi:hypothetical protein